MVAVGRDDYFGKWLKRLLLNKTKIADMEC